MKHCCLFHWDKESNTKAVHTALFSIYLHLVYPARVELRRGTAIIALPHRKKTYHNNLVQNSFCTAGVNKKRCFTSGVIENLDTITRKLVGESQK